MKTKDLFENSMRTLSWPSMPEARSAIIAHPLAAEYLFDSLVLCRAIAVQADGSVRGVAPNERVEPSGKAAAAWGETWPNKWYVCEVLSIGGVMSLSDIRQQLKEREQPHGHWVTLHSLWRLEKEGIAGRVGKGYTLFWMNGKLAVDLPDVDHGQAAKIDRQIWLKALKQVGEPYPREKVLAALDPDKSRLDMHYYEWVRMMEGDAGMIETMVKILREAGELPPAKS